MVKKSTSSDRWIWPFELLEKIGEGAMGVVYRARSVTNERHVALKLLPAEYNHDSTLAARFEREMEVLKTLRHPHIVHCYGGTCEGKRRFYAMELVTGGSLYDVIQKQGQLTWEQMVEYALQMCAGLGYAHQHGVVHRDVKPSNFLLTKDGKLKLSDFGLAHIGAASKLTAAGKTMGTYQYMAPEQIRGKDTISPQTDLYALGCVFFEMLSGRPPFQGETPAEILQQHLEAPPPRVSEFVLGCPDPTLADLVIARMLDKSIDKRPASAEEIAEWLEQSVRPSLAGTRPARTVPKPGGSSAEQKTVLFQSGKLFKEPLAVDRKWLLYGGGVLFALLVLSNVLLLFRGPAQATDARGLTRAEQLWADKLEHPISAYRVMAVEALGEIAHEKPQVVDILIAELSDERPDVREKVVEVLGNLGEKANRAAVELIKLKKNDGSATVREKADEALRKITGTAGVHSG